MKWYQAARNWNELRPDIKSQWPRLTDEDLTSIAARQDLLVAKIEERYGILEEDATLQVQAWLEKRSPAAEVMPYRITVGLVIAMGALLASFIFLSPPWGFWRYIFVGVTSLGMMTILFLRRRRLEF
jgi:uncharacterized protein YjbJ (UPF0337 family)